MGLDTVSQALVAHQAALGSRERSVREDKSALARMAKTMFWGVMTLLIGLLAIGISKDTAYKDLVGLAGLILLIAGTIVVTYAVISPLWQQANKSKPAAEPKKTIELEGEGNTLRKGLPAPPASITEHTTNILEGEPARELRIKN